MNRLNIPSPSNGIKAFWDDLEYMLGIAGFDGTANNGGIIKFLEDFASEIGTDNFIVTGCAAAGDEGWVFLDGELLKVPAHTATNTHFEKVIVNPTEGDRTDAAGTSVSIYDQYTATITAGSGSLAFSGAQRFTDMFFRTNMRTITSCNDTTLNGAYEGNAVTGAPAAATDDIILLSFKSTTSVLTQICFDLLNDSIYMRYRITVGGFSSWFRLRTDEKIYDTKEIAITGWNMTTSATYSVAHGLTFSQIRSIKATIVNNAGTLGKDLLSGDTTNYPGYVSWDGTNVNLQRGSNFNNAIFNAATGFITIEYVL